MIWLRKWLDRLIPDYAEARYAAILEKARREGFISIEDNLTLIQLKARLASRGIAKK